MVGALHEAWLLVRAMGIVVAAMCALAAMVVALCMT